MLEWIADFESPEPIRPLGSLIPGRFSGVRGLPGIAASVYSSILRSVPLPDHFDGSDRPLRSSLFFLEDYFRAGSELRSQASPQAP